MIPETAGGCFVTSVQVTSNQPWIFSLALTVCSCTGEIVGTAAVNIGDGDFRTEKRIDMGPPCLFETSWTWLGKLSINL